MSKSLGPQSGAIDRDRQIAAHIFEHGGWTIPRIAEALADEREKGRQQGVADAIAAFDKARSKAGVCGMGADETLHYISDAIGVVKETK